MTTNSPSMVEELVTNTLLLIVLNFNHLYADVCRVFEILAGEVSTS